MEKQSKKPKKDKRPSASSILSHFSRKKVSPNRQSDMSTADRQSTVHDVGSEHEMSGDEGGEPSNRDIMSLLKSMRLQLNNKLDTLNETIESLKGDVFDLQQENVALKAKIEQCMKKQKEMQHQIDEATFNSKLAAERADRNEQYSRRNNIKILFVEETGKSEAAEESEKKVLAVLHDKLGLRHIRSEDIEAAHRVGEKKDGSTRPIIVKFVSRKTKAEVIRNRRKLKNCKPKVVIVEDLTKSNYILFRQASDHPGTLRCWTSDGKIFAQDLEFKIHKIESLADLRKLSFDASTSTPEGAEAVRQRLLQNRRQHRANRDQWLTDLQIRPSQDSSTGQTTRKVVAARPNEEEPTRV